MTDTSKPNVNAPSSDATKVLRQSTTHLFSESMVFLLGIVGIALLWQIAAMVLDKPFLPTPLLTFKAFASLAMTYELTEHIAISAFRICMSLLLSVLFGLPLGYLCGRYKNWNRWLSPYISFFYPLPKIVFLPILIVLFGLGNAPKILLITLIICFQILVIVRDEILKIPKEWVHTMQTLTNNNWYIFQHLYLPYVLPAIVTGLRISLGTAIAVLFFSETFVAIDGLGYMILNTMEARNYAQMYASILLLSMLGFVLYGLLALWESKITYKP